MNPLLAEKTPPAVATTPEDYWGTKKQPYFFPGANPTGDLVAFFKTVHKYGNTALFVLLAKRDAKNLREPDKWAIPGGFVEAASDCQRGQPWRAGCQTPEETALRELEEETGYQAKGAIHPVCVYENPNGKEAWTRQYVFTTFDEGETLPPLRTSEETPQVAWLPLSDALGMQLAFNHNDFLRKAIGTQIRKLKIDPCDRQIEYL